MTLKALALVAGAFPFLTTFSGAVVTGETLKPVDVIKWIATIIQLVGYGLTGMNVVPWNVWFFFAGIVLWIAVGVLWKDRAIMVVHVGAFVSLLVGYLNA